MIGRSLSFCVKDILAKDIDLDEVELIVTGTKCVTSNDWEEALEHYMKNYWDNNPKAIQVVYTLLRSNKIYQPRVEGKPPPYNLGGGGIWVDSESQVLHGKVN